MMNPLDQLEQMTEIAAIITDGEPKQWANLVCPYCNTPNLVFSFTLRRPPRYGLFILCKNCKHWAHFSLGEKPPNFREELVIAEFQRLEDEATEFAAKAAS